MSLTVGHEPRELVSEVEQLLEEVEQLRDPAARASAMGAVQALLGLYGAGLERIVAEVASRDDGDLAQALAEDELISHLLLLHGLHPVAVEQRVLDALAEVRPYLESHGGGVELIGVQEGTVRLRLRGSCSGCPSSTMTLKLAIENAIHKLAPEIEEVVAEEEQAAPAASEGLLQIELAPVLQGSWTMAGGLPELSSGGMVLKRVAGEEVLFIALGPQRYAYRPGCPACQRSLEGGRLEGTELACAGCGNRFDVLRAGRCLDAPHLHLEPLPLLEGEDGLVKVALPQAA
jgi:Fe-S cluster biogenesis protein NfuA/nitrite reductase/ring-hydroxylating ferredoxin subunit